MIPSLWKDTYPDHQKKLDFSGFLDYNINRYRSYSLMVKRSNGNAEIQVRFLVGAP